MFELHRQLPSLDLADELGAPILHLERLYPGWHGLARTPRAVRSLLADLAIGERGEARQWDWAADRPGAWLSVLPTPDLIIEGVGADAIAGFVQQAKPDLLVIGTRGLSGIKRLFLGSVAQDLMGSVEIDVLAVPPQG